MPIYKTEKKKDGKQQYRVFVSYVDGNHKKRKKSKCVYGLQEARDIESRLLIEVKQVKMPGNITLQQLYDEYVKFKENDVRRSSLDNTKSILKNHVLNTSLVKIKINRITKRNLQDWKHDIAKKNITVTTKNNIIKAFSALFNYAVTMDYIHKNPLKEIGRFKDVYFQGNDEKIHYYTKEQYDRYIQVAKDNCNTFVDHACYVFFVLAFYTGMRKGEINALKWSDYDGDTIHVRRSIAQKSGYDETPPKNKSSYRNIRIPQNVVKILDEHRAILSENFQYNANLRICGGIKPIPDTVIENHNQFYAEQAKLPHIRIHDFRHSHATFLINNGVNIMEVSRRLGHSDVKMTWNTYSHLYPSAEDAALKGFRSVKNVRFVYAFSYLATIEHDF